MNYLDKLWPEDVFPLFDVVESTFNVAATSTALVAKPNPYRNFLFLGTPSSATLISFTTNPAPIAGQGIVMSNQIPWVAMVADGWYMLAPQQWFCHNAGGSAAVITVIEGILNRPLPRPDTNHTGAALGDKGEELEIAKLLRRQAKWRRKVYRLLKERAAHVTRQLTASARMAAFNGGGL